MDEKKDEENKKETPKSKNNTVLIIVIVIVVILVLGVGSCMMGSCFLAGKIKNAANDGIHIETPEGEVNIATDESGSASWPEEMISDIPKFTAGNIKATAKIDIVYTVSIENVKEDSFTEYKSILQSQGWEIEGEVDAGVVKSYSATKGNYQITVTFSPNENAILLSINTDITKNK